VLLLLAQGDRSIGFHGRTRAADGLINVLMR
jgi:hypothetical protein